MNRNKFGYPLIFDFTRRQDRRRLDNLKYMINNCPNGFKKIWEKKRKELLKNIHERNRKTLN